jgi:hypothetical protein
MICICLAFVLEIIIDALNYWITITVQSPFNVSWRETYLNNNPWYRAFLEKLVVTQLVKKFPALKEPESSSPYSQKPIFTPCLLKICLISFCHLYLCFPSGFFPWGVPTKIVLAFFIFPLWYMSYSSHLHRYLICIRRRIQIMKLLTVQIFPVLYWTLYFE